MRCWVRLWCLHLNCGFKSVFDDYDCVIEWLLWCVCATFVMLGLFVSFLGLIEFDV